MRVVVRSGSVTLTDPWRLDELSVVSSLEAARIAEELVAAAVGTVDDDHEHAWLRPDGLARLVPVDDRQRWTESFAGVVEYARTRGWVKGSSVRAHVEHDPAANR